MNKPQIVYSLEPIPNEISRSIFLAGPSLRPDSDVSMVSWRDKALKILEMLEYDGIVFVPEDRDGKFHENFNFEAQVQWETKCLTVADNIFFYINRDISKGLLGLTTNDEYGYWKASGKCVLVTETTADSVRYQDHWAKDLKVPLFHNMTEGLRYLVENQVPASRLDGERYVPLEIWHLPQFQSWYSQLKQNGNSIQEAKVLHVYRIPSNNKPFAFSLWANVFIRSENRHKNNEFVFSRPDISSCLLYYWRPDIMECEIVLVSEFRTPVNNSKGLVYELPGGSSIKAGEDPKVTIIEELEEECGFHADVNKLDFLSAQQLASTMLTHKSHLFTYKLDQYELEKIKQSKDKVFGIESDSERTQVHVFKVKEILDEEWLDWSNVGMILKALSIRQ